jgi:2'-5' RNA ligase
MQLNLFEAIGPEVSQKTSVYFEYFFLISPTEKIKEDVVYLKKKLHAFIGLSKQNLKSVPHISLLLTHSKMNCDNKMINTAVRALQEVKRFDVIVRGAGVFHHSKSKSLVLNIQNPNCIRKLFRSLHSELIIPPPDEMVEDFTPHLTIGSTIPSSDFYKLSNPLREFNYQGYFHCESISIMRRMVTVINGKKEIGTYTKVADVPLQ